MSFGGGGFGFGQPNQQQSSGFGSSGFGATAGTGGFGQSLNSGFGASNNANTGGSMFGGNTSGFGSSGTGFGANTQQTGSIFGAPKTTFGQPTGTSGGIFGNITTTTAAPTFGGFGGTTANTGFGGTTFGQTKPPFGAATSSNTNLFGSGGFATTNQTTAFGGPAAAGQPVPPSEGTAKVAFQAKVEKENNGTVQYQNISCQDPYQNYSAEELRVADYNQGRRFGNSSNQPGAFGSGSGFGNFGQTSNTNFGGTSSGGLFGATSTSTSNPFGAPTQTSNTFGGNNTTPFGAKPASAPTLFGTATSTAPAAGSFFGGSTQNQPSTNAFGGGSMFGNNAPKPGGLFGSSTNTSTPFGQPSTTTSSNPFGNASSTLFGGGAQQQQNTGSSGFSGFNQQPQQQQQGTGSNAFGNAFGQPNQQQQSGSLFGQPKPPSTGPFGQPQPSNTFGTSQQSGGGGIFGGQQQTEAPKPNLFGGGSTFGNTQAQPSNTLFGGNPSQPKPNMFTQSQGGGLFGNTNNAPAQPSLFGNTTQNQPQQGSSLLGSGGSSLFGNSQQQNPLQQQQPGSLHTDLLGNNVYGSASIFSGLPQPSNIPSGPVATPLKASTQVKKPAPLPFYKLNPSSTNRLITPAKKGYGFSYSTYGSPATPGSSPNHSLFGGSLLGGSLGRSLRGTTSLTNLRRSYTPDQPSIITPGAFSLDGSKGYRSTKRLDINRSIRVENIFASQKPDSTLSPTAGDSVSQPSKLKKRVSFDAGALGKDQDSDMSGALVRTETNGSEPTAEEMGWLRSPRGTNTNGATNGLSHQPEMEQVRGNELAIVPEDGLPAPAASQRKKPGDPEPGEYWSKPSLTELGKMSQTELKQVHDFEVGRHGCGYIHFDRPVDLTTVKLDNLLDGVIQIDVRSVTVYQQNAKTPPIGTGLNVPSTITLENSWARSKNFALIYDQTGPKIDKHIDRLKRTKDTKFVSFNNKTGVWVFQVEHFTTYEMYEDDDTEMENFNQSTMSTPPDTPTPKPRTPIAQHYDESTGQLSSEESELEDTYEFKKKVLPGAFGNEAAFEEDDGMEPVQSSDEPFSEERSAGSASVDDQVDESEEESESDEEIEMAGAFPKSIPSAEQESEYPFNPLFRGSQQSMWTPGKVQINLDSSWADQLQRTVSPKKQDREALREVQGKALIDLEFEGTTKAASKDSKGKGFRNSIDLMSSLFGKHEEQRLGKKQARDGKGFEWPYSKKPKTFAGDGTDMTEADKDFHNSFKSSFSPRDELLLARLDGAPSRKQHLMPETLLAIVNNVSVVKKSLISRKNRPELQSEQMHFQKDQTLISDDDDVPIASMKRTDFGEFANLIELDQNSDEIAKHEKQILQLAHILFDDFEDDISIGVPDDLRDELDDRIRKDRLGRFWRELVKDKAAEDLAKNLPHEEDAIIHLTAGNVRAACKSLLEAKDFHLATLIAQIGGDQVFREGVHGQIEEWRQANMISEMTEPIRALYEILAGNACKVHGMKGQLVDRASEFLISERFNLNWMQAFALRLWYVIYEDEPLETAVVLFDKDVMTFADSAWPSPPDIPKKDAVGQKNEWSISPVWTLLQIYAASKSPDLDRKIELPAAIMPKTITGDVFNMRLTFQLYHALLAIKGLKFRTSSTLSDQLAVDFASQIASSGQFIFAALVFLYLTNAEERERNIKELLARNAALIPEPQEDPQNLEVWRSLCGELGIPEKWLWEAMALHSRSLRNHDQEAAEDEVRYLLEAENWGEAHNTLCHTVAPKAVIECKYEMLQSLLQGFQAHPEHVVEDWQHRGAVYMDFTRVMLSHVNPSQADNKEGRATVLKRLVKALPEMAGKTNLTFEESVVLREMASVVADLANEEAEKINAIVADPESILRLPLTEDQRIRRTLEVGLGYYGAVMAQGR